MTITTIRVGDLLANPPELVPDLVSGLIRRGSTTVVAAPRNFGKSWLASNLAYLVGCGQGKLFGRFPVDGPAMPVVVAQGEMGQRQAFERWSALRAAADPDLYMVLPEAQIMEDFTTWRVGVSQVSITSRGLDGKKVETTWEPRLAEHVDRVVREVGAGLLIVDPWAVYYTGEENSNDQTEAALGALRKLSEDTGAAVVIFHHLGKSTEGRDAADQWRGASRLGDWPATRITLMPHYTPKGAEDAGLDLMEARHFADVEVLRRDGPGCVFSAQRTLAGWWKSWEPEQPAPGATTDDVMVALLDAPGQRWESFTEARTALGVSESKARTLLTQAVEDGDLARVRGKNGTTAYVRAAAAPVPLVPDGYGEWAD